MFTSELHLPVRSLLTSGIVITQIQAMSFGHLYEKM